MRGHRFQAHCYPTCENIVMRKPEEHYQRAVYFESGDVDFRKTNKEADPEVNSKGVLGYLKLFRIIPNLPLTAPIDNMHQLLKGNAKNLLEFLFNIIGSPFEIENETQDLKLLSEFKRSVRSLREIKIFKANELKVYLLYLSLIVFRPVLNDESTLCNLSYLLFAVRSLYESTADAKFFGLLLEVFCKNMHFKFPERFFDSINFHLLRHLALHFETFRPLWSSSAFNV